MRREKGAGTISKMSGNRVKPYIVRVPDGYCTNETTGKQRTKYKTIGYARTQKEGKSMLNDYFKKGRFYSDITFAEVHDLFKKWKYPLISTSLQNAHDNAFKNCEEMHETIFTDIDLEMLQELVDSCHKNYPTLRKLKSYLKQMYQYAIMNNLCKKNYAMGINIIQYARNYVPIKERNKISKKDLNIIWQKSSMAYYQMILFMIYTGVRVGEMLELKKENVNLAEKYFDVIESKSINGIRRVPIADVIFSFVEDWYYKNDDCEYLFFTEKGERFKYRNYYDSYFVPLMNDCGFLYTPHWCRHTFLTMMKECKADPIITKKIAGHKYSASLTERVYIHLDVEVMLQEVNKIEDWSEIGKSRKKDLCRTS